MLRYSKLSRIAYIKPSYNLSRLRGRRCGIIDWDFVDAMSSMFLFFFFSSLKMRFELVSPQTATEFAPMITGQAFLTKIDRSARDIPPHQSHPRATYSNLTNNISNNFRFNLDCFP